jgi:cytidylate kinase
VIVAIAGPIGVGKSTVARQLAAHLGYRYISGGEVFREIARQRGLSLTEVNKLAEQDPSLDRELDRRQRELAQAGNCVVESRLAGWMVDADLTIWLRAPLDVRAERVAGREGQQVKSAREELVERERSEWARYQRLYGIDISDLTPYHVIIETTYWDAGAIANTLAGLVRSMQGTDRKAGRFEERRASGR